MGKRRGDLAGLPTGEQPVIERMSVGPVVADTFAGRIHVEWDNSATVTPLGQLPFFIEFLKQGSLFDGWVSSSFLPSFALPCQHVWPNPANWPSGRTGRDSAPGLPPPRRRHREQICATRSWQTAASPF